jgi:hypothetical protein
VKSIFAAKCAGAALAIALSFTPAKTAFASSVQEVDENDDGVPDQWIEVIDSSTTKVSKDRNFDGAPDYELVYDERGRKKYEALDFNHDEKYDDFYYYDRGVLIRREIDTDFDEQVDLWVFLSQGVYIARVERDRDGDGEVDYVKDYGLEKR